MQRERRQTLRAILVIIEKHFSLEINVVGTRTALAFAGDGAAVVVLLVGVFAVRLVIKLVFKK